MPEPRKHPLVLLVALLLLAWGCEPVSVDVSPGNGDGSERPDQPATALEVSYTLHPNANSGSVPDGVEATATFRELNADQTLVTLTLEDGSTETGVAHTAHIHERAVEEAPDIGMHEVKHFLTPVDATENSPAMSQTVLNVPLGEIVDLDAHVKIHESNDDIQFILASGNMGVHTDNEPFRGSLEVTENPREASYELRAVPNEGNLPDGIAGTAHLRELNDENTLVMIELEEGSTSTQKSHPAHVRENAAEEGGDIAFFLGPLDGHRDSPGRSAAVIPVSFDVLSDADAHIQIRESYSHPERTISRGNIGANAN